jgi:hypothetical protein
VSSVGFGYMWDAYDFYQFGYRSDSCELVALGYSQIT